MFINVNLVAQKFERVNTQQLRDVRIRSIYPYIEFLVFCQSVFVLAFCRLYKHGNVFPSFVDVAIEVEKYINKSEYSDENKSNYKGSCNDKSFAVCSHFCYGVCKHFDRLAEQICSLRTLIGTGSFQEIVRFFQYSNMQMVLTV